MFTFTLILLVAAFAVAQQDTKPPRAPAGDRQTQTQSQPGTTPGQAATPGMPASTGDIIEGCLGGSNPNYTVTDKAGTTYQLQIPEGADASSLAKHIGESVQVQGSVDNSGSTPGSGAASSSSAGAHSIRVSRIGRGTSNCPGSSSTPKPPSK
jgi:hypothetical protein